MRNQEWLWRAQIGKRRLLHSGNLPPFEGGQGGVGGGCGGAGGGFGRMGHKGGGLAALRSPIGLRLIRTGGVRLDSGKVAGWMPI